MATKYNLFYTDDHIVLTRAKKQALIAVGDASGYPYRVVTDSGTVVHEVFSKDDDACEHCGGIDIHNPNCPAHVDRDEQAHMEANVDGVADLGDRLDAEELSPDNELPPAEDPEPKKFDVAAMKRKIAGLLAKAEGTDNEDERDAFNAGAERLMLKLGIERAELEAAGEARAEGIVEQNRDWLGNYSLVMVPFTYNVANGFGNLTVMHRISSAVRRTVYIIGHESDVEEFMRLLNSLERQSISALKVWQKSVRESRRGQTDMQKFVGNRSFLEGFGRKVASRLLAERQDAEGQASAGASLVLASKLDKVVAWQQEQYPELREVKLGGNRSNSEARIAGAAAGATASLGEKAVGGNAGELS